MAEDAREAARQAPAAEPMPPCRHACPVHVDVRRYLAQVAEGDYTGALATVIERNPLPAVCGRVCMRPCEDYCRRSDVDDPLAIAWLKRAASDHGEYPTPEPAEARDEKVAVVGSGPAGLTAAFDLAMLGYRVTLFEAMPELGGMLRYGIPEYRLPAEAIRRDVDHILAAGVDAKTGVTVGEDVSSDELDRDFDATVMAIGLQGSRKLPIPGADLPLVTSALPFLAAARSGKDAGIGTRPVVIGGGNVAFDVARTALRLGAESVTLACLESREEMPASEQEIEEGELEGVDVRAGWGPTAVTGEAAVDGVDFKRCTRVFDADGRFSPEFDEDETMHVGGDSVVFATGQGVDLGGLEAPTTERGLLSADASTCELTPDGLYACGDAVVGPSKIIDAIAAGHRAAAAVHAQLGGDRTLLDELLAEAERIEDLPESVKETTRETARMSMPGECGPDSACDFHEIEEGYARLDAVREALRCLACTGGARLIQEKCAACMNCVRVCPYDAVSPGPDGYPVFDLDACRACGACAAECPAVAIEFVARPDEDLLVRLDAALAEGAPAGPISFVCSYSCAVGLAEDSAERTVVLPCLNRLSEPLVLKAYERGAASVIVGSCFPEGCQYGASADTVERRLAQVTELLESVGLSFERQETCDLEELAGVAGGDGA